MANLKNTIAGAAFGTLVGTLSTMLYPKQPGTLKNMVGKAREYKDLLAKRWPFPEPKKPDYRSHLPGSIGGFFIGAGLAMLFAPKTGRQVRAQIVKTYKDLCNKTATFDAEERKLKQERRPQRKQKAKMS